MRRGLQVDRDRFDLSGEGVAHDHVAERRGGQVVGRILVRLCAGDGHGACHLITLSQVGELTEGGPFYPVQPKHQARFVLWVKTRMAPGRSRERHSPLAAPAIPRKHMRQQFVRDNPKFLPDPQSKPGQANPSPAKPIQIKLLGFAWFYSSESGLINGLQRFQIRIFPLALRLVDQARLAWRAFVF